MKRSIYIIIGIVVVALLVWIFALGLQSREKTATLDVQSAVPTDITVTVDGEKVASTGKVGVKPGSHTINAKRDGFADKVLTVDVKNNETKIVRILLTPNGPAGEEWARNHPDQFREYEAQAGKTFTENSAAQTQQYPLVAHLPEIHPTWRIDYGASKAHPNDPGAVAIIITYGNDVAKQNALDWIKAQGFNPADYEIIFQLPPQPGG